MKASSSVKLIVLGLLLLGAGVALRAWERYTCPDALREMVYQSAARALDARVTVGAASLHGLSTLRARHVTLFPPDELVPLLEVRGVECAFEPFDLFRGAAMPRTVLLLEPRLRLLYHQRTGKWNFESVALKKPGRAAQGRLPQRVVIDGGALALRYPQLFADEQVHNLPGIDVTLRPGLVNPKRWDFVGRIREGPFRGIRFEGWFDAGDPPALEAKISAENLMADRAFLLNLPAVGKDIWAYAAPSGLTDCTAHLSWRPGRNPPIDYRVHIDVTEGRAKTVYFPAEFSSTHGSLTVHSGVVSFHDLSGSIEPALLDKARVHYPPAQVRMNGRIGFDSNLLSLQIEAVDVPICAKALDAIPDVGKMLHEELRPEGRLDLSLRLDRPAGGRDVKVSAVARLRGATFRPPRFPLPLEHVTGTVEVCGRWIRFHNVRGLIRQNAGNPRARRAASFRVSGLLDTKRKATSLNVHVKNLYLDRRMVISIPQDGEDVWEFCRPEVTVTGDMLLVDSAEGDGLEVAADLKIAGGSVRFGFLPFPLTDLSGSLSVAPGKVQFRDITGTLRYAEASESDGEGVSRVSISGIYEPARKKAVVYLKSTHIMLDRKLVETIPWIGKDLWQKARPRGPAAVSGRVIYDVACVPALSFFFAVDLDGVCLNVTPPGVPVQAVSGRVLVSAEKSFSSNLEGVICGGPFDGEVVIYYGHRIERPACGISAKFERIDLGQLARAVKGEAVEIEGKLSGAVDLGGELAQKELSGQGSVSLTHGYLGKLPFYMSLINVFKLSVPSGQRALENGHMRFRLSGGMLQVEELTFCGAGLEMTGAGTVGLDGTLDLDMVAVTLPETGKGIPILTPAIHMILRGVEKRLARLRITGTLQDPVFKMTTWRFLSGPLDSLLDIITAPFTDKDETKKEQKDTQKGKETAPKLPRSFGDLFEY